MNGMTNETNVNRTIKIEELFGVRQYSREFQYLKPILRMVMESMIYAFMLEGFSNYLINLISGGKMISQIANIPALQEFDTNRKFAIQTLTVLTITICAIFSIGIVMFNQKHLYILYQICFDDQFELTIDIKLELIKLAVFSLMHLTHFTILSIIPILFLYCINIYRKHIEDIGKSCQNGK